MNVLGDEFDIVCIHVEMASFRMIIACFCNGSIRTSGSNVTYGGGINVNCLHAAQTWI